MYIVRAWPPSPPAMAARAQVALRATWGTSGVGGKARWGIPGLESAPGVRPVHWGSANGEFQPPGWHLPSFQTLT